MKGYEDLVVWKNFTHNESIKKPNSTIIFQKLKFLKYIPELKQKKSQ